MTTSAAEVMAVTEAAADKVRSLAAKEGRANAALRVRVLAGGCSGFTYELAFEDEPAPDDHVIKGPSGVRVLVDPTSEPIVRGSTLDFDRALFGGGLRVRNPQAVHECSCGDSFGI
jgi:iron-sulfur cluster assembly protein